MGVGVWVGGGGCVCVCGKEGHLVEQRHILEQDGIAQIPHELGCCPPDGETTVGKRLTQQRRLCERMSPGLVQQPSKRVQSPPCADTAAVERRWAREGVRGSRKGRGWI